MNGIRIFWIFTLTVTNCLAQDDDTADHPCSQIPGLSAKQAQLCRRDPNVMTALDLGHWAADMECRHVFRNMRWNCTIPDYRSTDPGLYPQPGSLEAAFVSAIRSAGVAYAITHACSQGNLTMCGCENSETLAWWKWKGCKEDVKYGLKLSRMFLDDSESRNDAMGLTNIHNNRAGRKAVQNQIGRRCNCARRVSGSCRNRNCRSVLPRFRDVSNFLMERYLEASTLNPVYLNTSTNEAFLVTESGGTQQVVGLPNSDHLVYLNDSPDYCAYDPEEGSLGTRGRQCIELGAGPDACALMCCGRGYDVHRYTRQAKCNCQFHWCCHITCDDCTQLVDEYVCQ